MLWTFAKIIATTRNRIFAGERDNEFSFKDSLVAELYQVLKVARSYDAMLTLQTNIWDSDNVLFNKLSMEYFYFIMLTFDGMANHKKEISDSITHHFMAT